MPDFSKIWATNSPLPEFNFTDSEYLTGWDFVAASPPTKSQFDAWFRLTDQKLQWLYDQLQSTANKLYPIGSVYISFNSADPSTLFGGVWQRLKDTFLLANGDTYAAGTTGGSATKTITVNNMPAHNHSVNSAGTHNHTAKSSTVGNHTHSVSGNTGGAGSHNHNRGNMNITGKIGGDDLGAMHGNVGGAFYHVRNYLTNDGIGNEDEVVNGIYGFDASKTWTGTTNTVANHTHSFSATSGGAGSHSHTITVDNNGAHTHTTNNAGGSQPISIMPPYTTVYVWKRTA